MEHLAEVFAALRGGARTVVWMGASTTQCVGLVHLSGLNARTQVVLADEDVLHGTWQRVRAEKMPRINACASVHAISKAPYNAFSGVKLAVLLAHPTHACAQLAAFLLKDLATCQVVVVWPHGASESEATEWVTRSLKRDGWDRGLATVVPSDPAAADDPWSRVGVELEGTEYFEGERETVLTMPDGRTATVVSSCSRMRGAPPAGVSRDKADFFVAHTHQIDLTYVTKKPRVVCVCEDVVQYLRKSRHWSNQHQLVSLRAACAEFPCFATQHAVMDFPIAPSARIFAAACRAGWQAGATTFRRTSWFPGDQSSQAARS